MKTKHSIPIFDATLWIFVSKDIECERKKMSRYFGTSPIAHDYNALCSSGGSQFALFFEPKAVTTKIIAHEVFHLTHRIMEWAGTNFDENHHEQGALLCGYLMELVTRETKCKK